MLSEIILDLGNSHVFIVYIILIGVSEICNLSYKRGFSGFRQCVPFFVTQSGQSWVPQHWSQRKPYTTGRILQRTSLFRVHPAPKLSDGSPENQNLVRQQNNDGDSITNIFKLQNLCKYFSHAFLARSAYNERTTRKIYRSPKVLYSTPMNGLK